MTYLLRVSFVACVIALALAGSASAQWEPIASSQLSPSPAQQDLNQFLLIPVMDHFRNITVFSERESGADGPASDRYFLTALIDGQQQRLPVPPRTGVPFDVDLGPDGQGNVVAAYSRCETEPDVVTVRKKFGARVYSTPYPAYTAGRGCDIYRFDFASLRESKLAGASTNQASEMLPSIWKDAVAFARVYEQRAGRRGRLPYLYVRALSNAETVRSNRQPGGERGTNGLPGPTRLDLYGRRLSFVWNHSEARTGIAGESRLRLDTVDGGHRVLSEAEWGGNQPYASFLGPQGDRGRIYYGYQRAEQREGADRSIASLLLRYRITTKDKALSGSVPPFLIDASTDAARTYIATNDNNFSYGPGQIQRNAAVWGASDKPQIASVHYGKHRPPGAERSFYGLKVRARDPDGQIVSIDVAPIDGSSGTAGHADGGCGLGGKTTGETETWYLPTGRLQAGTHRYRVTVQSSSCDAANQLQSTTETFSVHA